MLEEKLYNLPSFQRQYEALLRLSVIDNIANINSEISKEDLLKVIDWNNMLSIASVLCRSENPLYLEASLRIAQTCILSQTCALNQKSAAAYILECLTNNLAISLAVKKQLLSEDYSECYSLQQRFDQRKNLFASSILINNQIKILNKFQYEVYQKYQQNDVISISAPTSAGKSYILYTILTEAVQQQQTNIAYIVPTRALINQVEMDLAEHLHNMHLKDSVSLISVPVQVEELDSNKSNIFIFTQERLHWFLSNNMQHPILIDLLIIDEAHKIEDGNRGILLQQKLEELVAQNKDIKVYFSSPFTSNPEILLDNVQTTAKKGTVNTQFVAVNQNLIYVSQIPRKPKEWGLNLVTTLQPIPIGTCSLTHTPSGEAQKMALLTSTLGTNGACIVYANGAADAEHIAESLYRTISPLTCHEKIRQLIDLVKKTIHPKYLLAEVLERGIAFHYGNMPLLIRTEIEKLFSDGLIQYLVCTSTLLEGVNLPAKSIVIRNPHRGKDHPLNANDFWNLAGRAGRWGKEFSGNIICIEPDKWKNKPEPNKSKQIIKRAIEEIENKGDDFLQYINEDRSYTQINYNWEAAYTYYYIKYIINHEPLKPNTFHKRLFDLLSNKAKAIRVPAKIIRKNPSISPIIQQRMFEYFEQNLDSIENIIPVHPKDSNAFEEYVNLLDCMEKVLPNYNPKLRRPRAILLINWMNGKPLSYIIKGSYESYQRTKEYAKIKTIPAVIREVMDNIETFVRYQFAKDSSCYIDILRYVLEINKKTDLVQQIPQLNLWLEFGVSEKTHLSLLTLGLNRNTVITLSEYQTNDNMTPAECLLWLKQLDMDSLNISPIIKADILRIL